jgi:zinc protease
MTAGDEDARAAPVAREALGQTELVEMRSESQVVTVRVVFDAGSFEDGERAGVTHLAARLMAEGGAGDLSYAEVTRAIFPMAGEVGWHVGREQTVFVGRVHREHLDAFYRVFRDVILRPQMTDEDFRRVLAQTRSELELELRGNDDEALGQETLQAMLYDGHPYEHPALGTETSLAAMRVDDVRAQRHRVFCGGRATVGVAGSYPDGFAARVRADVAGLAWETCVGRRVLPEPAAPETPRALVVHKPEAQSVAISMGMPVGVTRAHPDYPALVLAAAFLGQHRQFVGVLMQKIRGQRGLNYGDYAYGEHFVQEGRSTFPLPNTSRRQQYFSIWIRPVRPEHAHFATRLAVRELRRFVEHGMTQEELDRIRAFASRYYALYLQTESRRLGFAIDDRFYGVDAAYLERLRTAWDALTVGQINAAVRRHIEASRLQIAMVAPDAEALAGAIASERPSPIEYAAEVSEEIRAEDHDVVGYPLGVPRERIEIVPVERMFR